MIDVSIVIVSYNTRDDLERCLASLHDAPPAAAHEIIVVDNASIDGSADAARRWPDVQVIDAGANRGFAAANNIGIRASRGAHLLLLNSDTIVPAGRRRPAARRAARSSGGGGGRAASRSTATAVPSCRSARMISPLGRAQTEAAGPRPRPGRPGASAAGSRALTSHEQWPDWVSGACLLVRRADAEAVGLLDERFFMYTEDVDFCAAIRARGGGSCLRRRRQVVHLRGRSGATAPRDTYAAYRRSHLAFYEKHHPWLAPLLRLYIRARGA